MEYVDLELGKYCKILHKDILIRNLNGWQYLIYTHDCSHIIKHVYTKFNDRKIRKRRQVMQSVLFILLSLFLLPSCIIISTDGGMHVYTCMCTCACLKDTVWVAEELTHSAPDEFFLLSIICKTM